MAHRVLLLRGHHPTVWGLRPFERLPERFDVSLAISGSLKYDLEGLSLPVVEAKTVRDRLPSGLPGEVAALAVGDRILNPERVFAGVELVHAEELSLWFSAQAARLKARFGYKLVRTVWETLPLLDAYRSRHARRHRAATLPAADLFLAATERARDGLLLEGVDPGRVLVAHPGVDVARFSLQAQPSDEHVVISPGRLEWEKGHHDVLRAVAALRRGIVPSPAAGSVRVMLVGSGPEEPRLRRHAEELGIADAVEIRGVPYDEMPALYARASAMVLASLPRSGCALTPTGIPWCFWEEQFGLVLAEAMAAGLPLLLAQSGAIPEVAGAAPTYFAPGDYMAIARALADGPLARPPGTRVERPTQLLERYSVEAAAERIAAAYDRVLT